MERAERAGDLQQARLIAPEPDAPDRLETAKPELRGDIGDANLKVPERHLTFVLLANSDGLRWSSPLGGALVERSPFASGFLKDFAR